MKILNTLFALLLTAQVAFGQGITLTLQDGLSAAPKSAKGDGDGNLLVAEGHARYTAAARRGTIFFLNSDSVTSAAANVTKSALGTAKFINGIYNGSVGKCAAITRITVTPVAGSGAGPYFWNDSCGITINNVATGSIRSAYRTSGAGNSAMTPEVGVVLTAIGAPTTALTQQFEIASATSPANGYGGTIPDDIQGSYILGPNCVGGITSAAAGTLQTLQSTIFWEEITCP